MADRALTPEKPQACAGPAPTREKNPSRHRNEHLGIFFQALKLSPLPAPRSSTPTPYGRQPEPRCIECKSILRRLWGPSGVHGRQGRREMNQAGGEGERGGSLVLIQVKKQPVSRTRRWEEAPSVVGSRSKQRRSCLHRQRGSGGEKLGPWAWAARWPRASWGPPGRAPPSRGPGSSPCQAPGAQPRWLPASHPSLRARCFLRNVVPVPVPGFLYGAEIIHQIFGMCN